jgi:uncharacterized membrane protein YphA (DoxX/SURF4 family)
MKIIVSFSRIFVGILFIISGFIKLNDPLGFSYKLQEYFSTEVLNIPFLEPYALAISLFVVVFEVILGVFLLIGYKPKFTVWSLLLMIVFFTFLTFYSAYFDKVKDCGCFGDALKLTPWESFTKDVVLLVLILILFLGKSYIKPIFNPFLTTLFALLSFIASLAFGNHVLMHLPSIDFRAYKIGDNLIKNMSTPEDAPKAIQEFTWVFNVNGEEKTIITDGSYPTIEGDYVSVETEVIDESYNLDTAEKEGLQKLKSLSQKAQSKGYTVIGLSASGKNAIANINKTYDLGFEFYLCDEKALKTVVRSNPGVLELNQGTVQQKVHWNDIDNLDL